MTLYSILAVNTFYISNSSPSFVANNKASIKFQSSPFRVLMKGHIYCVVSKVNNIV